MQQNSINAAEKWKRVRREFSKQSNKVQHAFSIFLSIYNAILLESDYETKNNVRVPPL